MCKTRGYIYMNKISHVTFSNVMSSPEPQAEGERPTLKTRTASYLAL